MRPVQEAMKFEVEQKFRVSDFEALEARLNDMGTEVSPLQCELDLYFAHPGRDFARTDEALRIRRKGSAASITYKGPKLDKTTKTRREIDLELPSQGSADDWIALLEALGFTPVGEVRKSRHKAFIPWQGCRIEGSLDEVDRLGTFAELELVVEAEEVEAAKACIQSLAESLGLSGSERRSYLELLLESEHSPNP